LEKAKGIKEQFKKILATVIWVKKRKESKSRIMARLTSELGLSKIWYGSRGLHLLGAHICITISLMMLGIIFKHSANYFRTRQSTQQFHLKEEGLIFKIKTRLSNTRGLLMRFGTMSTTI
jgi:hypothetical protein